MIIKQILSVFLLFFTLPLWIIFYFLIEITSKGPFLFKQKRLGKDKKPFFIYKFRTMAENAENLKSEIYHLNEVDGPVFKIYNDPRYTKIGRFLSHTGLDELPQLINIIKGEMSFVGPRPLPINEARQIPKKYQKRFSVLPGITSPWILQGAHKLSFEEWMESDLVYIKNKSLGYDFMILGKSFLLVLTFIFKKVFNIYEKS
jgi:lipopolysaccharide/colanic/teichoic acid biosynthesis glycosyltransferase